MAKKIIVTQIGSRHRYLIPSILEKNHILCRLYTDSTRYSFLGRVAYFFRKLGLKSVSMNRLVKRVPPISRSRLYSSDCIFYKSLKYKVLRKSVLDRMLLTFTGISKDSIKWGVADADCVYAMYFENIGFIRYAKSKGLKIVVDFYERPMTYKMLIDEINSTPEFAIFRGSIPAYELKHSIRMKFIEEILSLADRYTVPSKHVLKSLEDFENFDSNKAYLLPYPSSIVTNYYNWKPIKHRVLFVGSDPINKGLLYCAQAATKLKKKYPDLDFRVAGSGFDAIRDLETFRDLNFIGFLNKNQLIEEFQSAEVFVFPTLFEGFAGVILEASSCGCPIITTENSGADPEEFPGIIIPEKDSKAIFDNVVCIFENPDIQQKLSRELYEYAKKLHPDVYAKRLVALFEQI